MRRVLFLGLLDAPFAARAQMIDVQPGARVRVTAPGVLASRFEGTVIARTADSIVVASPQALQYRLAISTINEVAVSQGKSRSLGAKRGALWTGGIAAGLLTLAILPDTMGTAGEKAGCIAFGTGVYAGIGALVGMAIGAESWSSHTMKPAVTVAGTGGAVRVGARIKF